MAARDVSVDTFWSATVCDADGYLDAEDNCKNVANDEQLDTDGDGEAAS